MVGCGEKAYPIFNTHVEVTQSQSSHHHTISTLEIGPFWEQLKQLHLQKVNANSNQEKTFLSAINEAKKGNSQKAETLLKGLYENHDNPAFIANVRQQLVPLMVLNTNWEALVHMAISNPDKSDVLNISYHFFKIYLDQNPLEISYSSDEVSLELSIINNLQILKGHSSDSSINIVLDTGSLLTILSDSTAKELSVKTIDDNTNVDIQAGVLESLDLNGVRLKNIPVVILDDTFLQDSEVDVQCILGWQVLQHLEFELDPIKKTVVLYKPTQEITKGNPIMGFEIPVLSLKTPLGIQSYWGLSTGSRESILSSKGLNNFRNLEFNKISEQYYQGGKKRVVVNESHTDTNKKRRQNNASYEYSQTDTFTLFYEDLELTFFDLKTSKLKNLENRFLNLDGYLGADFLNEVLLYLNGPQRIIRVKNAYEYE